MSYLRPDPQSGRLYFDITPQSQSGGEQGKSLLNNFEEDIGVKMLLHNRIEGIIPISCQHIDEMPRIYYETDNMQTLEQRFQDETLTVKTASTILQSLLQALLSTEPYFIEKEKILLSEDSVFLCGDGNRVWLCYYPLERQNVYDGLKRVMEFLMKHLEHKDREKAAFFYGIYNMISNQSVTLEELAEHLRSQEHTQIKSGERTDKRSAVNKHKESTIAQSINVHCLVRKTDKIKNRLVSLAVPEEIPLRGDILRIGRQPQQDISLIPAQVSREHAVIYCEGDIFQIEDKNSLNGTYVNGRKISAYVKVPCHPGDIITFADIPYQLV